MKKQIVVDGVVVDEAEGLVPDEDQSLLDAGDNPLTEPNRDDFESDEEFEAAAKKHKEENEEPWQKTDDNSTGDVAFDKHIGMKNKLKGRIADRDEENEKLAKEIESLKDQLQKTPQSSLKRPKKDDYESDEEYQAAKDKHDDAVIQDRIDRADLKKRQDEVQKKAQEKLTIAVDSHYERADKLIEKAGINPEVYQQADANVRQAVELVLPKQGNIVVDQLISLTGEGSEKVMYFIGNPKNKAVLNEFKTLLLEDRSGMKAAIYLGQQKERLTNPKKRTTQARQPSAQINGDVSTGGNGAGLKRKYDKAHKARNTQAAYNIKKEARLAKVDVSKW